MDFRLSTSAFRLLTKAFRLIMNILRLASNVFRLCSKVDRLLSKSRCSCCRTSGRMPGVFFPFSKFLLLFSKSWRLRSNTFRLCRKAFRLSSNAFCPDSKFFRLLPIALTLGVYFFGLLNDVFLCGIFSRVYDLCFLLAEMTMLSVVFPQSENRLHFT